MTGPRAGTSKRSRRAAAALPPGPGRVPFVAAIGLSAFLLFTLELLAGRLALPVFGGSPGVWTTALVLFTGLLFVGYLYAHIVATRLSTRQAGRLHLVVAAATIVATLLAPNDIASLRVAGMPEALNVLYALLLIVGAPIFLLASTTPLLSAWYSRRGGHPWWLYAVSNGASFLALLCYPLAIEPFVPLSAQRASVSVALLLYTATLVAVVLGGRREAAGKPAVAPAASQEEGPADRLGARRQLSWLVCAAIPAGLLSATTSFVATDLVSAPLLWIGPLAIYLASFVVAFSERGRLSLRFIELLAPAAAMLLWIPFFLESSLPLVPLLMVEFGSFAVLAIALHGRLALDRPEERHLTRFYLILSAGGLVATGFVALLAPLVFSSILEYPILIVAAIWVLGVLPGPAGVPGPGVVQRNLPRIGVANIWALVLGGAIRLLPFGVLGGLFILLLTDDPQGAERASLLLLAAAGLIFFLARAPVLLAGGTAITLVILTLTLTEPSVARIRTFFGVLEVLAIEGPGYAEYSGTTLHGLQFTDERAREPTTYYVRSGPLGDVFNDLRSRTTSASIGVVGLGTGTIAVYAQPGDALTFFEIDQAVIDLAESDAYFSYLRDSAVTPRIVVGDARLSVAVEPDAAYDVLVLDAFTSDAVPAHLLTREAIAAYISKLRPAGILAFHISNRYYNLANALSATAQSAGLSARALSYLPGPARSTALGAQSSEWVVVGKSEDVERFSAWDWSAVPPGPVLTDDFADLLRTLR